MHPHVLQITVLGGLVQAILYTSCDDGETMRVGLVLCFLAALASAQTPAAPKPFKATAQLGVPYVIGAESIVIGSKEKVERATEREVTLDSAELSLVFPNRQENVFATSRRETPRPAGIDPKP